MAEVKQPHGLTGMVQKWLKVPQFEAQIKKFFNTNRITYTCNIIRDLTFDNSEQKQLNAVQNLRVYKGVTRTVGRHAVWECVWVVRFKRRTREASEYIPAFTNSRNTVRLMYGRI